MLRLDELELVETDSYPLFTTLRQQNIKIVANEIPLGEGRYLRLIMHTGNAYFELALQGNEEGEMELHWFNEYLFYQGKICFNTALNNEGITQSIVYELREDLAALLIDNMEAMITSFNTTIRNELAMEIEECKKLYREGSILLH
ncbi:hypothetical protein OCT63_18260 [Vibrio sp. RW]|uniref:hypothetical protein n=1 Tax=Vibrio sp. RW TaxID=2998833 RepID=UPI0022CDBACE|nr:hypothetical protein [Vibrio sp. RW]MDA0146173.1 hypothetical protein [Vibrio sp. RW]